MSSISYTPRPCHTCCTRTHGPHGTHCTPSAQATLLSRDELTGSLVQVLLLAITFEDGQGLILLAVLANQPAMHYGWSWLCECGRCAPLGRLFNCLLGYAAIATDEPPETETHTLVR